MLRSNLSKVILFIALLSTWSFADCLSCHKGIEHIRSEDSGEILPVVLSVMAVM